MHRLSPAELGWYDHVPLHVARRVRVVAVPVLAPGADGMTLGRFVLLRRGAGTGGPARGSVLLAHELVHARQWAELGVARFLWHYVRSYLSNLRRLRRHHAAYLAIPLEVEARAEAARWSAAHAGPGPGAPGQGTSSGSAPGDAGGGTGTGTG